MRRRPVLAIVAGAVAVAVLGTAGCAAGGGTTAAVAETAAAELPAGDVKKAEVYAQVVRTYLGTPRDNSFPEGSFGTFYVLDRAQPGASDLPDQPERGIPIAPKVQQHITNALAGMGQVVFIADQDAAFREGTLCPEVKDGGILITLGEVVGDDHEVRVAIHGFVACDGATRLTYVVHNQPDIGWQVTGTTGPRTIS
ncbi:hypothetical protein I0C86_07430 [Plantactinospora sp. S1510]|uniref:Lipoprotein n=1 Tax=Plantactinospora alkalitolerans TaxID=2789879 RepID=A0ABS0GRK3_9ACTN|nr:hypothetical protein [Plantactinospora alkalitolerans]MBF9128815.1 hypothetical protein [Plantactinospora alkalitolerans]